MPDPRRRAEAGSIPAPEGQPSFSPHVGSVSGFYPRSRGATSTQRMAARVEMGPSPLARGNQQPPPVPPPPRAPLARGNLGLHLGLPLRLGSIPARAGQPPCRHPSPVHPRVHPRSRGATHYTVNANGLVTGPSPLARGNLQVREDVAVVDGSIPARAGQPQSAASCACRSRVHPRSRGATEGVLKPTDRFTGPSPLARGTPPRLASAPAARGPSPLARGNPAAAAVSTGHRGSIPARAGQPWCRLPRR